MDSHPLSTERTEILFARIAAVDDPAARVVRVTHELRELTPLTGRSS
jgi:hypothetical protein